MTAITPMNTKPIVITEPGEYVTRSGKKVNIIRVDDHSDDLSVTRFNCKGDIYTPRPGRSDKREYGIWHQSGSFRAIGTHMNDIVGKLSK